MRFSKIASAIAALAFISVGFADAQTINGNPPLAGTGTVTSVGVGNISGVTTSGSPVTSNGSVTQTLNSQSANTVFIAPNGSAGAPSFRAMVQADLPSITATGSTTARTLPNRAADWINALDYGVVGDGVTDDGPALRTLFSSVSNKTIFFPPNHTYLINTNVAPTVAGIGTYPAMDNVGFIISQQTNFHVIAYGATFQVTSAIPLTVTAMFDRDLDWTWDGGIFIGNRTGLTSTQENGAFGLFNNNRFRISDIKATGFGGLGAAFVGDWNIAGQLSNLQLSGVGICFDFSMSKNLTIRDVVATGADTNGASGAGQTGNKCYSEINDTFYTSYNNTGVSYTATDTVAVENLDASNFATGVAISSGKHFRFNNVSLHDNPGISASSVPGIGYYFYYQNGGSFTSVGFPVTDVTINGGQVANNGSAFAGYGLFVDASTIANGDIMSGFNVSGVTFQNNTNTGIAAGGSAISNFTIGTNNYYGAAQTTPVSANVNNIARQIASDSANGQAINLTSAATDLGYHLYNLSPIATTTAYNWGVNASGASGNFYIYDQTSSKFPLTLAKNAAATLTVSNNVIAGGPLVATSFGGASSPAPTLAVGAAAGTGATVACRTTYICDNVSGSITLTTGTAPTTGNLFTITFGITRAQIPNCTFNIAAAPSIYFASGSTTTAVGATSTALSASTAYNASYVCMGN